MLGHAHSDRVEPVKRLRRSFDVRVYGEGWDAHGIDSLGQVYGPQSLTVLSSATCVIVFDRGLHGHQLIKPSLFDFTAAGALVITNASPQLDELFVPGEESISFNDVDYLERVVRQVVADPDRAEQVRSAGRWRTLRDYSWARAWRAVLSQSDWLDANVASWSGR